MCKKVLPGERELRELSVCKGMLNAKLNECRMHAEARKDKKENFGEKQGFKCIFKKKKGLKPEF